MMKILGINGSLRRDSYNLKMLKAAGDYFSERVSFDIVGLGDLPLYNQDLDGDNKPQAVAIFKERLESADALLFSTPEYNHSIPGVLQNAIDWASRPAFDSPLTRKPAGILSASMSPIGGARAQGQLRTVLNGTLSPVFPGRELLLAGAQNAFDASGKLTDADAQRHLGNYIRSFEHWLARH